MRTLAWSSSRWKSTTTASSMANISTSICPSVPRSFLRAPIGGHCRCLSRMPAKALCAPRASSPQNADLDGPEGGGKARITSSEADGKYIITHQFETSPAIIAPEDYAAMLKIESALGRKSSRVFLLQED